MRRLLPLRYLVTALLLGAALLATSCGSDSETSTDTGGDGESAMAAEDDGMHMHEPIDASSWDPQPTVSIEVTEDPKSGWNVHVPYSGMTLAPEHASSDPVDGEGHMHLYVDDVKVARLYGDWYHIDGLTMGEHEVRVELNANNHSPLEVDGNIVEQRQTIEETREPMAHGHMDKEPHDATEWETQPTVDVEITEDAKSGWNVQIITDGMNIVPEDASTDHIDGEGHMHLYVDDVKIARVYTEWFHLDGVAPGEHDVRVELNGNDHIPLAVDGEPVEVIKTINETREPSAPAATDHDAMHGSDDHSHGDMEMEGKTASTDIESAEQVFTVEVTDGAAEGDTGRQEVELGETIGIVVGADVTDNVHVHGYEYIAEVTPDGEAVAVFAADVPGLFEVELEGAGVPLLELQVK